MSKPARIRSAQVSAVTVTSTATQLATAPSGRVSVGIRNLSLTDTLYLAFSEATATAANGWPIRPLEVWTGDLADGIALWGVSGGADIDVRVMQGEA